MAVFVLGLTALLLHPEPPDDLDDHELEALMSAPEASDDLPAYFYEVAAQRAALALTSEPTGAHVSLNAEVVGRTPLGLDALRPGYYALHLRHPDFLPLDTTLYLASGAFYRLDVALTPRPELADSFAAETAEVVAEAGPAREPARRVSPPIRGAAPGGFERANPETLQRVWHTGSLSVTSEPSGARVLVDGQPRGQTPLSLGGLRPGAYTVTVTLRGYERQTHRVQVGAGAVHHVEARLAR